MTRETSVGTAYTLEFRVTGAMVQRFAALTGDFSSLHVDKTYARRSVYRKNVVHGMLPLLFLSALRMSNAEGYTWSFRKLTAKFYKPAFIDERYVIDAKIVRVDGQENTTEFEYSVKNLDSDSILTVGTFSLLPEKSLKAAVTVLPDIQNNSQTSLLNRQLDEQIKTFQDISMGDKGDIVFRILPENTPALYSILADGLAGNDQASIAVWGNTFNVENLLASCTFSTFVGIVIPGKYGTFVHFSVTFSRTLLKDIDYRLVGEVVFKSNSTSTIVEDITVYNTTKDDNINAHGRIMAKVNEAPVAMPTLKHLKNDGIGLGLRDKIVLVTGASRGIGETTAKLFSLYGAKVMIDYLQGEEDAQKIVQEIVTDGGEARAIQADVSDKGQVVRMVEAIVHAYGRIDVLVNNAVRDARPIDFLELTWDELQKDIDVIVKGAFNCCQAVIPVMMRIGGGKIINISTLFTETPSALQTKYVVAKSGLVGLTRSLAVEFARHEIQVNLVVPSIVETDLASHVPKLFLQGMKHDTPMKRHASAVDVAKAVVFLASSLASFTTGQKIMVTGGNAPFL